MVRILGINDLQDPANLKESKALLAPFLSTYRILHMFAPGGLGKTFNSMILSHALATGQNFLNWKNESGEPVRVLYLDGEMGIEDLKNRLVLIDGGSGLKVSQDNLRFITYEDFQHQIFPNLANPVVQKSIFNPIIEEYKPEVIVIDNLDTCTDKVERSDTEVEIFKYVRIWANQQKAQGRAIVIVDHANKNGNEVYGTSKKQNACDVMIQLRKPVFKPAGITAQNYYELHFRKGRQQLDDDKKPLWIEQHSTDTETQLWFSDLDEVRCNYIKTLRKPTGRGVADILGVSTAKAQYLIEQSQQISFQPETDPTQARYDEELDDDFTF